MLQFMGSQRVGYDLAIEQQQEIGFMTLKLFEKSCPRILFSGDFLFYFYFFCSPLSSFSFSFFLS